MFFKLIRLSGEGPSADAIDYGGVCGREATGRAMEIGAVVAGNRAFSVVADYLTEFPPPQFMNCTLSSGFPAGPEDISF